MDTNDKKPAEATNAGENKKASNGNHFKHWNRNRNRNRQNQSRINQGNEVSGQIQAKEPSNSDSAKPFVRNDTGNIIKDASSSSPDNVQNNPSVNGQPKFDGQKPQNRNARFQKNRKKPYPKPDGQSQAETSFQEDKKIQNKRPPYSENHTSQGEKKQYSGKPFNDNKLNTRGIVDSTAKNISDISRIQTDSSSDIKNPSLATMSDGYISKVLESAEIVDKSETDADDISDVIADSYDDVSEDSQTTDSNKITEGSEEAARDELVEIIGVKFKQSGKVYYFSPAGLNVKSGSNVIVETARGIEYGNAAIGNKFVELREIVPPLRNAIRNATPEDDAHYAENAEKEKKAFEVCNEKIEKHKLEMKLINVEYTFDNNKLLFYFTAESRIDFRDLVKDLASVFRTRIELRQIGIRDEAKMLGGLGLCGRPFCCKAFLNDFVQVSIKMAKEQNMSLNSAKISGACGRLMCCLRYEYDTYDEELRRTPKIDSIVQTSDGDGVVIEITPLLGTIKVKMLNNPDAPPKTFNRDEVKVKGYAKTERRSHVEKEIRTLEDK